MTILEKTQGKNLRQTQDIEPIIKVRGLHKYFGPLHVLRGLDLDVAQGEVVVIIGPSGGGKSTFLRCLNFLEQPSTGTIEIGGVEIDAGASGRENSQRIQYIRKNTGMVFQQFNLFPHMTALGNIIEAPTIVKKMPKAEAIAKAEELLAWIDLSDKRDEYPSRLSGGQQQRVAIARAIVGRPKLLLADEPTGNLDSRMGGEIMEILEEFNREEGTTLVMVTHDPRLAERTRRTVRLFDGRQVQ